ncbi:anaerobic C4-dicarboxylate transporter [Capnocytophaga gingivalis]|jgi:transporter, anaerobic C4-dicarboxylate uptake (dcu) family|uniref:Anaerobic C4-dicarboxylate transporter n=1 Tax=Capnocytophaga gingivalis TaxID=1017 RepID=A0A250FRZ8_9FLAO|nr:anaerobic C4-dicarboxylate transporter [Capnocytophaga gingivalis]ATA87175.1 anaerobic C4-dicarboxylate transporter [Capnocytophaga gingivalis]EEK15686.1 transporter, anaerobic C4-dicarboxylate uptake (Dcu) family [Capnocytophaga gingivalis ATCC 33624]MEB3039828.1 anaerobic C4-dicarboxylate transporter [Capnocytophaga gingivalis]RKW05298.1 MAG: anaerobic C4-dicarboxylate transporter [Capnocytophaga sp.]
MNTYILIFEFLFLLGILYIGSRYGGIGLGVISGIGLVIEVFVFRMPPASAPIEVMLIILAVVTCASILEAAGGLKFMLQVAEKILRKNPKQITFLGPIATYTLTLMLGTGHAVYSIMPIIGDIALKNKIRPERPMAAASVASQLALTASPISAVVTVYLGKGLLDLFHQQGGESLTLINILSVTLPATFLGLMAMCFYSLRRGKELEADPEYQRRLQDPIYRDQILNSTKTTLNDFIPQSSKNAVYIFLSSIVLIVVLALYEDIRTFEVLKEGVTTQMVVPMGVIIQMVMLCFGGIILTTCKTSVKLVPEGVVFKSGMVACVAIFGIAWMSDTYFTYAMPYFKDGITAMVQAYPWTFIFALFAVSIVINSQAATAKMMLPVAITMGLPVPLLIGIMPATYAYFFIPNYPSDIATVNFDPTGTTKIGKYYFNHSFMVPGLIAVGVSCLVGIGLSQFLIR